MNDKIHILVCDDEEICLAVNRAYISTYSKQLKKQVEIYEYTDWNEELAELIRKGRFDIAFLDIDLEVGDGMNIAKELQKVNADIPIIFVTSHEEYKPEAIDILATGYIPKPIIAEKFYQIFKRALVLAEDNKNHESQRYLMLKSSRKEFAIQMVEIICLEKIQKKIIIKTKMKEYEVTATLLEIEPQLLSRFQRISQSVIVNMNEVVSMDRKVIHLSNGEEYPIGITYAKTVWNAFHQ